MIFKLCQYILLQSILHEQLFPLVVVWDNAVFGVFSVILPLQNNLANQDSSSVSKILYTLLYCPLLPEK